VTYSHISLSGQKCYSCKQGYFQVELILNETINIITFGIVKSDANLVF